MEELLFFPLSRNKSRLIFPQNDAIIIHSLDADSLFKFTHQELAIHDVAYEIRMYFITSIGMYQRQNFFIFNDGSCV
jgi:hypothetical protein